MVSFIIKTLLLLICAIMAIISFRDITKSKEKNDNEINKESDWFNVLAWFRLFFFMLAFIFLIILYLHL